MVSSREYVGQTQQRRQQRGIRADRQLHHCVLCLRDADGFTLAPSIPSRAHMSPCRQEGLQTLTAGLVGAVRPNERCHDKITGLKAGHFRSGVLDAAAEGGVILAESTAGAVLQRGVIFASVATGEPSTHCLAGDVAG